MGLFGPSKAERAATASQQQRLAQEETARAAERAAAAANDQSLTAVDEPRFRAEFKQWLDAITAYQESTQAPHLTDEVVLSKLVMPLPSSKGMSRMGATGYVAGQRAYARIFVRDYEARAINAEGPGAMSFWRGVNEYVEGALLRRGL